MTKLNNLTENELMILKQSLLNIKKSTAQLEKALETEALEDLKRNTSEHVIDADLSTESSTREMDLKIAQIETSRLNEIDSALDRMQMGKYGLCEECEDTIPFKRLNALPFTRYCIACEEALEIEKNSRQKGHETDIDFGKPIIRQFK